MRPLASDAISFALAEMLPRGGWVVSMQASFDDGGNGDASITCVAGYFFRDDALIPLHSHWRRLLGHRRFHMVDLVHGSPYSMCAMMCLAAAAKWMEQQNIPPEDTMYFFESGNTKQAEANKFLDQIVHNAAMDERYRYVSHSFAKKNKLASLDAADLLGWEWTQQCKRIVGREKRPPRASLKSLCEKPHIGEHFGTGGGSVRMAFARALLEPFVLPAAGRIKTFIRPQGENL